MGTDRLYSEEPAAQRDDRGHSAADEQSGVDPNLRLISLFNHYRHDWMNDIQVLFGYVKLKKYDKLESLMEKIKEKVRRESNVAKLGVPELIVYLLSVQAEVKDLLFEVDMSEEIRLNELPLDVADFSSMCIGLIEAFKRNAQLYADGEQKLALQLAQKSDCLQLNVRYAGEIAVKRLLAELENVKQRHTSAEIWRIERLEGGHAAMHVEVPYFREEVNSCL
ncbi:Spo0B domain-containing protein [Paenibacillus xerothermodurans]|nr:Spo0B domain-containing protein [Paenibacillus xerothermodurans]